MIIAGIDYSYTSPAICVFDTNTELHFNNLKLFNCNGENKGHGVYGNITIDKIMVYKSQEERFRHLADWAFDILSSNKVEKVMLEGYSMGSKAGLIFQIAENCSLLKQKLDLVNIDFICPSPSQVKKHFTGKGNATKDMMIDCFAAKYQIDLFSILNLKRKKTNKPIDDLVEDIFSFLFS